VGIKVKGGDLAVVDDVAHRVEALLRDFPGTQSVIAERISRGYFIDARLDLERMASHGVTVDEAMPTIQFAIGGDNVVNIRQADKTIVPLAVQYSPEYVDTLAKVRNTPVVKASGQSVPLSEIADVSVREAPEMIRNDNGDLASYIYVYLNGITAPEYVEGAREYLRTRLTMPPGYSMEWTGLYQYAEDARSTLRIVVPVTLAIMFMLLVLAFRSIVDSSLVMLSAPFALVGGVFLQWYQGYSMTTAVIIGYVSRHHHGRVHSGCTDPSDVGTITHGRRGRRLGREVEAKIDDGRDDGPGTAADHVREWLWHGHHEAHCRTDIRWHDHLDGLRAVSDSLLVCDK
jgi:copper/silver efflux system protein